VNSRTATSLAGVIGMIVSMAVAQESTTQDIPEKIVRKVDPSVVCIMHERACGSGFVVTKDGYILTNGHVVQGTDSEDPLQPAKLITVITYDEKKYPAKVLGFCMNPDVALIKIEPAGEMQPVEFADTRIVKVGEKCFAVGAPLGLKRTYTSGILSSVDRTDLGTCTKVFQTDAAINPGNSGGPLFDPLGHVIGINTYGIGQANNLGFTIPAHVIQVLKDHFLKHGRFVRADTPLFITAPIYDELAKALKVDKGVLVDYVMPATPAEKAGLRTGDIITEIDGNPCSARTEAEMHDLDWDLTIREPGSKITFTVLRGSPAERTTIKIPMTLEVAEPMPTTEFPGEVVTCRNDTLGFGYRQLVRVSRLILGVAPESGVMLDIQQHEKDGAFARADLRSGDVVTKVAGKAVSDPDSFRRELQACLVRKDRYIDIAASRRNVEITTSLAPYYDLKGKKIALVMPSGKSEYLDLTLSELIADGADIAVVSASGQKPEIGNGYSLPVRTLQEVRGSNFNAVVFMDGADARGLSAKQDALRLVKEAASAKRILAAIGASSLVLAAGDEAILKKKLTTSEDVSAELITRKANYTGSKVEKDDNVITTTGFDRETVRDFVRSLRQMVRGTETIRDPAK
jgi:serine protease Do